MCPNGPQSGTFCTVQRCVPRRSLRPRAHHPRLFQQCCNHSTLSWIKSRGCDLPMLASYTTRELIVSCLYLPSKILEGSPVRLQSTLSAAAPVVTSWCTQMMAEPVGAIMKLVRSISSARSRTRSIGSLASCMRIAARTGRIIGNNLHDLVYRDVCTTLKAQQLESKRKLVSVLLRMRNQQW